MTKGYMLVKLPERCSMCRYMYRTDEDYCFCSVEGYGFDYQVNEYMQSKPKGKPDWCPIKELPKNISTSRGRAIIELMHNNNITCEDFVERLQWSYKDLCRILAGELLLSPVDIGKIAEIFGVTKHDLINSFIGYKER